MLALLMKAVIVRQLVTLESFLIGNIRASAIGSNAKYNKYLTRTSGGHVSDMYKRPNQYNIMLTQEP